MQRALHGVMNTRSLQALFVTTLLAPLFGIAACGDSQQHANHGGGPSVQLDQPAAKAPHIDEKDIQAPHIDGPSVNLGSSGKSDAGAPK